MQWRLEFREFGGVLLKFALEAYIFLLSPHSSILTIFFLLQSQRTMNRSSKNYGLK